MEVLAWKPSLVACPALHTQFCLLSSTQYHSKKKLFNVVLKTNFYPSVWGIGHIVPIFKSGTVSDPSNYRGITISSCLGKLFSIILNNRLISFLDLNNLKRPEQIGFSKRLSNS